MSAPPTPAHALYWNVPGHVLFTAIPLLATLAFVIIVLQRLRPLLRAQSDPRFDRPFERTRNVLKFWLLQWKHPRYLLAGLLHILIFAGFLVLSVRSISLVITGFSDRIPLAASASAGWAAYDVAKDYAATLVFLSVIAALIRRVVFHPQRYAPAPGDTRNHTAEAVLVLVFIAILMFSESVFEATGFLLGPCSGCAEFLAPLTLAAFSRTLFASASIASLMQLHRDAYLTHELTFFAFLCFLPFGKHFHVFTSLFNIYFAKLDRGSLKPVLWNLPDEQIDKLPSLGIKRFEDFTWKHMLDFYSCADCGRCSDNCPAHASGRPLSPRFLSIKARDYSFTHFPVLGRSSNGTPLLKSIYSAEELWSCTTCGACEAECPMLVEYIDKIVDLRRGMVDDGEVPASLQKPLRALESRGNPYGKLEKKRSEWARDIEGQAQCHARTLDRRAHAETLFFVDSVSSYDARIQRIARATALLLESAGEDYGILGGAEKDSGHEVRRFGEEFLFTALREHNTAAIANSGARRIVTSDPHTLNALRHDYVGIPPVEHTSQFLARAIREKQLRLKPLAQTHLVFTYHDPCYLGRHNQLYDEPREALDSIGGLRRVEMQRCRDRSFCCGGGGLMLFYEARENERMGVQRVKMAAQAGANVIVTACPFCMLNLEDAVKVSGLESKMAVTDLTELILQQLSNPVNNAMPEPLSAAVTN